MYHRKVKISGERIAPFPEILYHNRRTERGNDMDTYTIAGWTAQIIQNEIDHCEGILI